jgi:hypothetical protein
VGLCQSPIGDSVDNTLTNGAVSKNTPEAQGKHTANGVNEEPRRRMSIMRPRASLVTSVQSRSGPRTLVTRGTRTSCRSGSKTTQGIRRTRRPTTLPLPIARSRRQVLLQHHRPVPHARYRALLLGPVARAEAGVLVVMGALPHVGLHQHVHVHVRVVST